MKQLQFLLLLATVFLVFSSCEKETKTELVQQAHESEINNRSAHKIWDRLTWSELQNDLNFLEIVDELELDVLFQGSQNDLIFIDSSTITKCSDITNDYYSFTFPVHTEPSSNVIKNVILEKKGLSYKSNIIEYTIGFDDLYALMTNTFTAPINIPVAIYPVNPNTIQVRGCILVIIHIAIPCPCEGHTSVWGCTCPTKPIVYSDTYLECDSNIGGDGEGINIFPTGDTGGETGGGGGTGNPPDNGDNSGTEILIPIDEWYAIKLLKLNNDYDLGLSIEELKDIVSIDCMGDGNPLVGEFEECAIDDIVVDFLSKNPTINSHIQSFLTNNPNNSSADNHADLVVLRMISDKDFKTLVESSFGWSGIMWTIAKELVGDKAVDILAGIVGAKDIRDAIKALKNNDWIEFTFEVSQIVLNNTPVGKFLKILEAGSEMYKFAKKIEKMWDKIGTYAENVLEQMWDIVNKYPDSMKLNPDLLGGVAKLIKNGVKSIDDVMASIPNFTQMSSVRMKHILHGDATGGLHHVSGLVNDPTKQIIDFLPPDSKGIYKVKIESQNGWNTMFPDSKSEIGVAKSIQNVHDNPINEAIDIPNDPFGRKKITGIDSQGIEIEIITESNGNIVSAFPLYKP